jgi:nitroreductase
MNLDVFETIKCRRSIRNYQERFVEENKLFKILEAARLSPSAANLQPLNFILIRNQQVKEVLSKSFKPKWFKKAPVIIAVCATPEKAWKRIDGEEFWKIDAAIALQNMILAATAEGLGTCWIGAFDEKKAKDALGIPENVRIVLMTPIGYPAENKEKVIDRKPLAEIIYYDKWGK